jgi:hypothetical protein
MVEIEPAGATGQAGFAIITKSAQGTVDLDSECSDQGEWEEGHVDQECMYAREVQLSQQLAVADAVYELSGVILFARGHFTCYIYVPKGLPVPCGWYYYDDIMGGKSEFVGSTVESVLRTMQPSMLHALLYVRRGSAGASGQQTVPAAAPAAPADALGVGGVRRPPAAAAGAKEPRPRREASSGVAAAVRAERGDDAVDASGHRGRRGRPRGGRTG